jgi:hypothetical protein
VHSPLFGFKKVDTPPSFAVSAALSQTGQVIMKNGKRRSWTTADVRTLKSLARKKTRASKIAKTLKRTEGATRQKAFSLGVSLHTRV